MTMVSIIRFLLKSQLVVNKSIQIFMILSNDHSNFVTLDDLFISIFLSLIFSVIYSQLIVKSLAMF